VVVDQRVARAFHDHFWSCDSRGLSHDFRHGALRESSG
jgi:hypothetical protein